MHLLFKINQIHINLFSLFVVVFELGYLSMT